jgi:murein DD-endopeptidase MepM/ murein hydrolase activator NlpD
MKQKIEKALRALIKTGMAGIITLLIVNVVCAAIPVSDGFDYPVGIPDGVGYAHGLANNNNGWDFLENEGSVIHPGEDWNGNGGGDTDLGDSVYAISNGRIVAAGNYGSRWGNIILIEHQLQDGTVVWSNYAHLRDIIINSGDVYKG